MFILADLEVCKVFFISISFFGVLVLKFWLVVRNKTAEKRLKMAIFRLLVLLYAQYSIFFILLFEQYEEVLCCVKIQEKA